MFSMSISLPDGTVPPTTVTHTVLCGTRHCVPLRKQPVPVPGRGVGGAVALSPVSLLTPHQHCVCHRLGQKSLPPAPQGASWGDGASSLKPGLWPLQLLSSRACAPAQQSPRATCPALPLPSELQGLLAWRELPMFPCLPPSPPSCFT